MKVFTQFSSDHKEFIHDIAYDYYGKRLATGSSDYSVKIWEQGAGENWECTNEFKSHNGPVLKLAWAHPEFGQVLASCSTDRSVHIHEELADGVSPKPKWHKKGALNESTGAIRDLDFSPRHHGLKLATVSEDGMVRIYESNDVLNLGQWLLWAEFEASAPSHHPSNPSNHLGKACCLSWNPSTFDDQMLCVGAEGSVAVWQYGAKVQKWQKVVTLPHLEQGIPCRVHDVAWAPAMGRQYHLIATGCSDKGVRVFKIIYDAKTNEYKVDLKWDSQRQVHEAEVWRVSWNITGTVLASTGDDGKAKLWESDFKGNWTCSVTLSGRKS